jgi:hypothetical protein
MTFYHIWKSAYEIRSGEFGVKIYSSEDNNAPNRITHSVSATCDIKIRLTTPFDQLPVYINKLGEQCRRVDYDIEMTCSGALLKFAAIVNGIRQPAKNVEASFL